MEYNTEHQHVASTDDEGRYRIFGLGPGKYIVSTIVGTLRGSLRGVAQIVMSDGSARFTSGQEEVYPEMTEVYVPSALRQKDARVFEIHAEEQISDADLKVDLKGLHTVNGKVLGAGDRHEPTQSLLFLREDGAKDAPRMVRAQEDGSFQIHYLPPGRYTLELMSANDKAVGNEAGNEQIEKRYKAPPLAFVVGEKDVVLDMILLTALKPVEPQPSYQSVGR